MSEDEMKRLGHEEETDEVEAHARPAANEEADDEAKRAARPGEPDDEVEAHGRPGEPEDSSSSARPA
jgi:hypothetical protein